MFVVPAARVRSMSRRTGAARSRREPAAAAAPGDGYSALMRSSAPFGHSLPYLSTYFFCANVRNAAMSGV